MQLDWRRLDGYRYRPGMVMATVVVHKSVPDRLIS